MVLHHRDDAVGSLNSCPKSWLFYMHSSKMYAQAQPCSSSTVFLSLPQLSRQPSAWGLRTTSPLESNANVQNWVVKRVTPITYEAGVETSHGTSHVPSIYHYAWIDCCAHQVFPNETPAVLPDQTKTSKPMRCEVCKTECNSKDAFEEHMSGKKHKRNMQLQNSPTTTILSGASHASSQIQTSVRGQELFVAEEGTELESKRQKLLSGGAAVDSVRLCTICNIACNSQEAFSEHLAGKKHAAQVGLTSKKMKVAQPARCEFCKIECNSRDVYISHLSGKKHLKNSKKLSEPKNYGAAVAIVSTSASQCGTNPEIGLQEKPDTSKHEGINSHKQENAVTLEAVEKDVETKTRRRKLVGVAAATCVKLCTLCNVVCNSETVFNSHLAGHKHAAMLKKQAGSSQLQVEA